MKININQEKCMICGKELNDNKDRVKGHLIPKCLKPKDNVIAFFHKECEDKINKLYVSQQKKPTEIKIINILKNTIQELSKKIEELKINQNEI